MSGVASIGDYVDVVSGPAFKSDRFTDNADDIPLIKGENIAQGHIAWEKSRYWPANEFEAYERFRLGAGDIVVAMDRPWVTGGLKWARLTARDPSCLLVQRVARLRARQGLKQDFLTCVIGSTAFAEYVRNIMGGTNVPHISGGQIKSFRFRLPSEPEQEAIASTLSAYDDLIDNNRRRIALLEEAARLLYREWFVHLRFPGHEHVKVVNGVPEGWVRKPLAEVAECRLGKMLDQNKNKGELMPYLANVNVRWGAIDLDNLREMRFEDNELDAAGLRYGDIVMCEGGEPGRCALWKEQRPGMMIQKAIHRIRARAEVSYLFLYYCLRHNGQSGRLAPLFTGATIKHLPREKLAIVKVAIPPAPLMTLFADRVNLLEKEITVLEASNRLASQARDLLLPRLMSGDIAV